MADLKVRDEIKLTSPDGVEFTAKWAGGTRSVKKRLAMYAYAGINGQVVDDYGSDSVTYPINIIFDGDEHRKTAKTFFDAFREKGKWEVIHPTEGILGLQGVEATERDDPITEANITRVDTQWIEYIDPISLLTLRNSLLELGFAVNEFEDASLSSALSRMDDSISGIQEMKNAALAALKAVRSSVAQVQDGFNEALEAQLALQDIISAATITVAGLISAVQNIILAPGRAFRDLKARLGTFADVITRLFDEENDPPEMNRNDALIKEVVAAAVIASIAEGASTSVEGETSGLKSRKDLLYTIETFDVLVESVNVATERLMIRMNEEAVPPVPGVEQKIEDEYVPFEDTHVERRNTIAKTQNALRQQFFKLPTERRIITKTPTTIYKIAKDYFGTTGINDEVLTRIELANAFTDSRLLYIPQGTEIRIHE